MTIHVKRQADGQYLTSDEDGPIVWHPNAVAALALAKAAQPDAEVVIQHLRVMQD